MYPRRTMPKKFSTWLSLVTILSGFEINNFVGQPASRSAINLLPCLTCFDSGSEPFCAFFVRNAAWCWKTSSFANSWLS